MAWWIVALAGLAATSVGLLLLVLVGLRINVRYRLEEAGAMDDPGFLPTLGGLTNSPARQITRYELYDAVPAIYAAMLEAIRTAEVSITMETYLFWTGGIGNAFIDALVERSRSGVAVKLLLDADGSRRLRRHSFRRLREGGVEVRRFRPLSWTQPIQYNHRTHRKILVIDGRVAFTGGIGVADMWLGPPPWLELGVRLEGPVVGLLQGAFFQNWVIAGGGLCLGPRFFPPLPGLDEAASEGRARAGEPLGMVTTSSPIWGDSAMRLLYFGAIASARRRLYLASPYFLPSDDTTEVLAGAAARGVDVRLLLPGPNHDKALPYYASRRLYGPLLAAGVRLFEYQPAMMHAKAMVVDDRWATIGSTNFDPRSFFLNDELNTSIDDPGFAAAMDAFFRRAFAHSREVTIADWQDRGLPQRLAGWIGMVLKDQL